MLTHQKATGDEAWEGNEGGGGVLLQLQHGEIGQCIHCSEKLLSGLSILIIMWGGDLVMGLLGLFCFSHLSESLEREWQALSDVGRLAF